MELSLYMWGFRKSVYKHGKGVGLEKSFKHLKFLPEMITNYNKLKKKTL